MLTNLLFTASLYVLMCAARLAVQMLFPPRAEEAPAGSQAAEHMARGVAYLKEAEEKLSRGGAVLYRFFELVPFASKYQVAAAGLFEKAAIAFILAKSWDQAGSAYIKLANCYQKMGTKNEADPAALAYVYAANCYKKTNFEESISCLEQAANLFLAVGRLDTSAIHYKEIARLYEVEQKFDQAVFYYERTADLFHIQCPCSEGKSLQHAATKNDAVLGQFLSLQDSRIHIKEATKSLIECRGKVAQFAAQLENYEKSIEIYEDLARQSLRNNGKYEATEFLLYASICKLCKGKGDVVAIKNALQRYKDLDPTFPETEEYGLLVNLADALDHVDVAKFSDAVEELECMQDAWTVTLLSRLKEVLNAKELGVADLS